MSQPDLAAPPVRRQTVLIPSFTRPNGPVTTRMLRNWLAVFAGVWAVGALPVLLDATAGWKAFGLSLLLPGGGFLYTGHPWWALLSLVAVIGAAGLWFVLGPVLAPPMTWLATALTAGLSASGPVWSPAQWVVPAALGGVLIVGLVAQRVRFAVQKRAGARLNAQLARVEFPITDGPRRVVEESSQEDLDALRYPLNLLLQRRDSWEGFSKLDQFREGAVRYQLNWAQYALSVSQYTRTPAFTGYLSLAQRNAIDRMLDPINVRFWTWENLWGNLRLDRDPVAKDNIMYSAFLAVMAGMYETVTGDGRYGEPGALTMRLNDRTEFQYDFDGLAHAVRRNIDESPFGLYPCEPNWIYSICNTFGVNTLLLHDRLRGAGLGEGALDRLRRSYEEDFLRPDGHFVGTRCKLGPILPTAATSNESMMAVWLHASMPDIARRTWWLVKNRTGDPTKPRLHPLDRIDPGNYRIGRDTYSRIGMLQAARELGDAETAEAIQRFLDDRERIDTRPGTPRYPRASVWANLCWTMGRFQRENTLRDLLVFGAPAHWHTGPVLAEAAYPDVLVAKAVTDGQALDLVLRPGNGGGRTTIGIDRLVPGRTYRSSGARQTEVIAGPDGHVVLDIDLADRLEVSLRPMA